MTVATGFVQKVWTFGGTVPGPVIRVKVGDTIRVHLKNPVDQHSCAHSIDFHASQVAWNDEMTSIEPGEEKLYEWKAEYAGVWMYHCGTSPALHHIANGMYGMVIVEPKEGLPKVDKEFAIVQSEWYLGPQGKETDLAKAMAAAPAPDFVAVQRRREPVQGPPAPGRDRRAASGSSSSTPGRASTARSTSSGRSSTRSSRRASTLTKGNAGNWGSQAVDLVARPRARSSSSRRPRTASTRSSPTRSTSSGAARWASSRPATATRRTERTAVAGGGRDAVGSPLQGHALISSWARRAVAAGPAGLSVTDRARRPRWGAAASGRVPRREAGRVIPGDRAVPSRRAPVPRDDVRRRRRAQPVLDRLQPLPGRRSASPTATIGVVATVASLPARSWPSPRARRRTGSGGGRSSPPGSSSGSSPWSGCC